MMTYSLESSEPKNNLLSSYMDMTFLHENNINIFCVFLSKTPLGSRLS